MVNSYPDETAGSADLERLRTEKLMEVLLTEAKSHNTVKKYDYAFASWRKWIGVEKSLPASPHDVGLYLTSLVEKRRSPTTLQAALYAIKWRHKIAGMRDPTLDYLPLTIIEASKRKHGRPVTQKAHLRPEHLRQLCQSLDKPLITMRQLRFLTFSLLTFAGFLRFSEASSLRIGDVMLEASHLTLSVRNSKTDQYSQGKIVYIARTGKATCPVRMLERYYDRAQLHNNQPDMLLFRRLYYSNNQYILSTTNLKLTYSATRHDFHLYFQNILPESRKYGLHSFRSGGATAAAEGGVASSSIKKHGRWISDASKDLYVRHDTNVCRDITRNLGI